MALSRVTRPSLISQIAVVDSVQLSVEVTLDDRTDGEIYYNTLETFIRKRVLCDNRRQK